MEFGEENMRVARVEVGAECAGFPVEEYLAHRFTYHSLDRWRELLEVGRVTVDGRTARAGEALIPGCVLQYVPLPCDEPPVDAEYRVLYEDDRLIAVDKSGNIPCHPAGKYFFNTLWWQLRQRGIPKPIFVHRLDRETSGIVVVAKDPECAKFLGEQFLAHSVEKRYRVTVEGETPASFTAQGWLMRDADSPVRKKRKFVPGCKGESKPSQDAEWAETDFRRVSFDGSLSELEARPLTGRTHQIRATLCSLGYPVAGDKLYGVDETIFLRFLSGCMTEADVAALRFKSQQLRAVYLRFMRPMGGMLELRV